MDWVGIVEAAYGLEGTLDEWLDAVLDAAMPVLDEGLGAYAYVYRTTNDGPRLSAVSARGLLRGGEEGIRRATEGAPIDAMGVMFAAGVVAGSARGMLEPAGLGDAFEQVVRADTGGAIGDFAGVVAHDGVDLGIALAGARAERAIVTAPIVARWTRAAAHLGAGCRLRCRLEGLPAPEPEAIFAPDGRVSHAEEPAKGAVDRLRRAVVAVDRARGPLRRESPDDALELWTALIDGRWSLVDRFESDGRRYVVAHRNEVRARDPRGLTPREHAIAEALGRGRTVKEVAYELGVGATAISNAAARVRKKLGLRSMTELVLFFAPGGLRARLVRFELADEPLLAASMPALAERLDALPPAERAVAIGLLEGRTYASIARRCGTSERTVANQAGSVFRKLGVSSRAELAAEILRESE